MNRKLTENEYKYLWYIEYGDPFHYIGTPPEIAATIKKLLEDGICIQLPNPTVEKGQLYTRFTRQGRMLFLAHEVNMMFFHPTELEEGTTYDNIITNDINFEDVCIDIGNILFQ